MFISKIQLFQLPSFCSAWHQNRNTVWLKKSLSSWFSAVVYPFQVLEDVYMRTCAGSWVKRKRFDRKSELQMFLLISGGHIGAPKPTSTSFPGFSPTRPTERARERDPGKRWSCGSRAKLFLREESFVSHFFFWFIRDVHAVIATAR